MPHPSPAEWRVPPRSGSVLAAALVLDLVLILLSILRHRLGLPEEFRVGHDRGYPEMFNFLKWAAMAVVCAAAARRWRNPLFLALGASALLLLADDALLIHERLPVTLLAWTGLQALDLPADHSIVAVGVVAGIGALCVGLVLAALRLPGRAGPLPDGTILRDVAVLVLVLAAFGLVVDAVHVAVDRTVPALSGTFLVIEEGGEMLTISYLLAYLVWLLRRPAPEAALAPR